MKPLSIICFVLICQSCFAQFEIIKLHKNLMPKGIRYTGNIINAVSWKDKLGENYLITTETGIQPDKEEDNRKAALYAHHYLASGDSLKQMWRVYDHVDECPFDAEAFFIKNTFAITDLDKNGKAEVWLMYHIVCRSDVSPAELKIIMYEDNKKHAMRGRTKVPYNEKEYTGGKYSFDDAFKKASPAFRKYAEQLWNKNVIEKWGE